MTNPYTLHLGDCLESMRAMPDNSVDSIVTDPPAGIAFMGKDWDKDKGGRAGWITWMQDVATECLRIIKPGGHALVWAIPRTSHWTGMAWEVAGWQPRDKIFHVFGSGFPKSLNVSVAIDKMAGAVREVVGVAKGAGMSSAIPNVGVFRDDAWVPAGADLPITAPATEDARQWQGWGTALKPAVEEWWLMRKPFAGTVVDNVLTHGTGALNIDGCRVGDFQNTTPSGVDRRNAKLAELGYRPGEYQTGEKVPDTPPGRWPATLIHDGSEEVLACFPDVDGPWGGNGNKSANGATSMFGIGNNPDNDRYKGSGSAARFFYCAKASKRDRDKGLEGFERVKVKTKSGGGAPNKGNSASSDGGIRANIHPTVKPTDLMRYLCRLVTPPGGTILDPFCGSGSTGKAAMREGFRFIGCEMSPDYIAIAKARIEAEISVPLQLDLIAA